MAYMNQEKKAKIAQALKAVVPAGWKYSLAVRNHSTICMTVSRAPVDLIAAYNATHAEGAQARTYCRVNNYHLAETFSGDLLTVLQAIVGALNLDNHDKSDYHDVGHYIDLSFGDYGRPFVCTAPATSQAA